MRSICKSLIATLALCSTFAAAQQRYNVVTQLNWTPSISHGAPTGPCDDTNAGQPDSDVDNQVYYFCGGAAHGWVKVTGTTSPLQFTGPWSSVVTYTATPVAQAAFYSGSWYVSLQNNNINQNPASATTYWAVLFSAGSGITQLTGDIAAGPGSGSVVATLSTVNASPGPCGDATHVCQITTNGKGQTTAQTSVPISAGSSLTTQTNGTNNTSQTNLNIQNGTNTTASNPSAGNVQINVPTATPSTLGVVKPDGTIITDTAGVITVPTATNSVYGVVKPDGATITQSAGVLTALPSGNNVATVILAASNSPGAAHANIQCSGTNDETCINNALTTFCPANTTGQVNGCRVVLKNGVYKTSGTIHQKGNSVQLEGEEPATWGGYRHGSGNGGGCNTGTPCGDIATGGAQIRAQSNYGDMIEWDPTPTPACGPTDSTRSCGLVDAHLYLVGYQYTNAAISQGGQADMSEVDDVMIQQFASCLNLNTDSGIASKVRCQDDGALGTFAGEHTKFRDGLVFDVNGSCGVFGGTTITGNTFGDCGGINDSSPAEITGNDFYRIFCGSVWVFAQGYGGTITGNNFDNSQAGCSSASDWIQVFPESTTGYGAFAITGNSAQTGNTYGQGGFFINAGTSNGASVTGNAIFGGFNGGLGAYNVATTGVSAGNAPGFSGGAFYSNSTAYIIGDYVTYAVNGRKYVCIANSTGNLPTNGSFWTQLSSTTPPLMVWYKGESITGVTPGNPITTWPDSSGWPSRQMTVAAGGPLYESSSAVDSKPGVRFAGADVLHETEIQMGGGASSFTIFVAVTPVSLSGGSHEALVSGPNVLNPWVGFDGFGNASGNCCGGGGWFAPLVGSTFIMEYVLDNSAGRVSGSGTLLSVTGGGLSSTGGWSPLTVGATGYDGTGNEFFLSGDVADVLVFNGAMSNADAAIVGAAMCAKYGVTCGTSW